MKVFEVFPPFPVAPPFVVDAVGFLQPRQLLHMLSGSELHVQMESSSKRSESSKLKWSHSSPAPPPPLAATATAAAAATAALLFHCWITIGGCCPPPPPWFLPWLLLLPAVALPPPAADDCPSAARPPAPPPPPVWFASVNNKLSGTASLSCDHRLVVCYGHPPVLVADTTHRERERGRLDCRLSKCVNVIKVAADDETKILLLS